MSKIFTKKRVVFFVISVFVSLWIIGSLQLGKELWLDQISFISTPNSFMYNVFTFITFFGSKWGIIGVGIISLFIFMWRKDYIATTVILFSVIGGNELNKGLKELFSRERPLTNILEEGYSFPSGHAMVGLIFYGFLAYLCYTHIPAMKYFAHFLILLIFLIGISRAVIGVHYLSDVIGGFAIGYIYLFFSVFLYEKASSRIKLSANKQQGVQM
jgi:undecaprenyl-diphosphatase